MTKLLPYVGVTLLSYNLLLAADSPFEFESPVRLQADGKVIDTGPAWGHSSPSLFDVDGDSLPDLVLGDFSGNFHLYRNTGTVASPTYTSAGPIKTSDGAVAHVNIYCCIGSQPRFRDLTGDGLPDMLANSYDPGHAYLFRALPDRKFAPVEEITDKSRTPVRSSPVQKQNYQSFGSFYDAVDWDDDGDLDLLIGCFDGNLKLRMNEGSATRHEFATDNLPVHLQDGTPLSVKAHCCPVAADFDSDGLWDIVSGADDGSVTLFRNVGKKGAPAFAPGQTLVPKHPGPDNGYNAVLWSDAEATPGIRSQPEVVDYNHDGKPDLLVGDFYTAYDFKPGLTDQQKQQVRDLIKESESGGKEFAAKFQALQEDFKNRYPGDQVYSDKANKEWSEAYRALRESPEAKQSAERGKEFTRKLRPFLASTRGTGEDAELAKSHGHVWLYLRK